MYFLKYHEYPFCQSQPKIVRLICGAYILFMENFLDVHSAQLDENYQNWLQNLQYIVSNTISILFGSHTQKLCTWFLELIHLIVMKIFLDVHGDQMKIIKTGCKVSNGDIRINLQIVETTFWHWMAYGMSMVLNWIHTWVCHKLVHYFQYH